MECVIRHPKSFRNQFYEPRKMFLSNTSESFDGSVAASASALQKQQILVTTNNVRNQHFTLAQMRGVIQILIFFTSQKTSTKGHHWKKIPENGLVTKTEFIKSTNE